MNYKKLILTIIISIIIAIVIILFGYLIKNQMLINTDIKYTYNTKSVFAKDGKSYKVHNFSDADDAANTLSEINKSMIKLISYLKYKYIGGGYNKKSNKKNTIFKNTFSGNTSNKIISNEIISNEIISNEIISNDFTKDEIIDAIDKLLNRYNPDNLIENSPKDKQDTSYTLNKGSTIAFCLREKDSTTQLHDLNTLIFVAIHELAHIAIDDNDHPPKFWKMFKFLLEEAELGGIYKSKDYKKNPVHYCGMEVNYNPIYDSNV